jgi:hypothetical protein
MRRIGVLMMTSQDDPESRQRIAALRQGLDKFGWTEGRNIQVDYRWARGEAERAQSLAKELIAPPTPTDDQLLAMVETRLAGDRAFQAKLEAMLVKVTGRVLVATPQGDDDDGVDEILAAAANKTLSCDRPPPPPTPGPVQEISTESIVPENVDDFPEMPEFLRRKEEIRDGLLQRMPYLRHDPDRLEAMVLERIR